MTLFKLLVDQNLRRGELGPPLAWAGFVLHGVDTFRCRVYTFAFLGAGLDAGTSGRQRPLSAVSVGKNAVDIEYQATCYGLTEGTGVGVRCLDGPALSAMNGDNHSHEGLFGVPADCRVLEQVPFHGVFIRNDPSATLIPVINDSLGKAVPEKVSVHNIARAAGGDDVGSAG